MYKFNMKNKYFIYKNIRYSFNHKKYKGKKTITRKLLLYFFISYTINKRDRPF